MELPNPDPRPEGEVRQLERIWAIPGGYRLVIEVNNTVIGLIYIGVALLFFLMAGVPALIMRALDDPRVIGGAFEHLFAEPSWSLRAITWINRVRYRLTRNYYGDQGIFVQGALWVVVALTFRYASLASQLAALAVPLGALALRYPLDSVVACAAAAGIVVYRHRDNIARLTAGTERRLGERRPTA